MARVEFIDGDRLWSVGWEPGLQTWFASFEPWPVDEDADLVDVAGTSPREVPELEQLWTVLDRAGVGVPSEVEEAVADREAMQTNAVVRLWSPDMVGAAPWHVGTESQRWEGYLDPATFDPTVGQGVLRNLVGATTYDQLREREDTYVAIRGATMRGHGIPGSYDLEGLQAIHRHLFQDVYGWAGELRTVNIGKGRGLFASFDNIAEPFGQLSEYLATNNLLRDVPANEYAGDLARVYNVVNTVHPFREGNGRTQREFVSALAREAGYELNWSRIQGWTNDRASEAARAGDLRPMEAMFARIVTRPTQPTPGVVRLPDAVNAAYPRSPRSIAQGSAPTPSARVARDQGVTREPFGRE